MTAIAISVAFVATALIVRDVLVRALSSQVRLGELRVEAMKRADFEALEKRLATAEGELNSIRSAVSFGKVMGR